MKKYSIPKGTFLIPFFCLGVKDGHVYVGQMCQNITSQYNWYFTDDDLLVHRGNKEYLRIKLPHEAHCQGILVNAFAVPSDLVKEVVSDEQLREILGR